MDVARGRLLGVADDQDELGQGGPPALAAILCQARGTGANEPLRRRRRCRRRGVHRMDA
jgi:hypothetical protein